MYVINCAYNKQTTQTLFMTKKTHISNINLGQGHKTLFGGINVFKK